MSRHYITAAFIFIVSVLDHGNGSRILAVCPTASISHQVVFRGLTLALNKRGHDLVVVTTDPVRDPSLKNYTEIDISFLYDTTYCSNFISIRETVQWLEFMRAVSPLLHTQTDKILNHPELKKLYKRDSNEKFDLLLMEMLYWPAFLPLAKRFDVPIVGVTSLGLPTNIQYAIGNPIMPSHPSNWETSTESSGSLTFWQKLNNFINVWKFIYYYKTDYMSVQEETAKKYFGSDALNLDEIERNVSIIFVNQQGPISYARPNVPNVIEVGGFHVSKQSKSLPKDLQKILDEATQGFLYMSLGSNVKSNMLSDGARAEFIAAFSKLPYKVIWKFEDDVLPGKPDNVLVLKWAPQQAILAHPNLKAFIYQGGLQSTEEAIAHGVPLIGLPVFGDQDMQVDKMVSLGVAKKLEITAIHRDDLLEAIRAVTLDRGYKQRMLNLQSLLKDKLYDPMENAIWWTEYVIRRRDITDLHSVTASEPWYRRQEIDVIAFISAVLVLVLMIILLISHRLLRTIYFYTVKSHDMMKKIN